VTLSISKEERNREYKVYLKETFYVNSFLKKVKIVFS